MKFKGTYVFSAIVIALSVFTYFEMKRGDEEAAAKIKNEQIFGGINKREINEVKIVKGEEEIHLKKEGGKWQTLAPIKDKGDPTEINSYIRDFSEQKAQALTFEDGQMDLDKFGLNTPAWSVQFINKNGQTKGITVGSERAFDQGLYFQKEGDGNVYVSDMAFTAYLDKSVNAFRSKVLFPEVRLIRSLRLVNQKDRYSSVKLTQAEGHWALTDKPSIRLDQQKVKEFAGVLQNLLADEIVSDKKNSEEYKKYRLNKPEIIIDMIYAPDGVDREDKKTATWKFRVGEEKENTVYLRSNNTKSIYKSAKYKVAGLYKNLDDFRNREFPFAFDVTQVERLQLEKEAGAPTVVVKKNNNWTAPDEKLKVNNEEVEKLLQGLRALRAEQFVRKKNVKAIKNKVVLSDVANKDVFSFQWGGELKKDGESFYYVKTNLADETFTLKTSLVDKLIKAKLIEEPATEKSSSDKDQ